MRLAALGAAALARLPNQSTIPDRIPDRDPRTVSQRVARSHSSLRFDLRGSTPRVLLSLRIVCLSFVPDFFVPGAHARADAVLALVQAAIRHPPMLVELVERERP